VAVLWVEGGEVFDAKVPLGQGVAVGQSIEQWPRQFGRPDCLPGYAPYKPGRFEYLWEASYFACTENNTCGGAYRMELQIDAVGKVVRVTWSFAPGP